MTRKRKAPETDDELLARAGLMRKPQRKPSKKKAAKKRVEEPLTCTCGKNREAPRLHARRCPIWRLLDWREGSHLSDCIREMFLVLDQALELTAAPTFDVFFEAGKLAEVMGEEPVLEMIDEAVSEKLKLGPALLSCMLSEKGAEEKIAQYNREAQTIVERFKATRRACDALKRQPSPAVAARPN